MLKKSKIFKISSSILAVVLVFVSANTYSIQAKTSPHAEGNVNDTVQSTGENPLNKLHFYIDNEENSTIDDVKELQQATADLKAQKNDCTAYAVSNTNSMSISAESLQMTVQFESSFMETEEYKSFLREREELEDLTEIRKRKSKLNAYSKEYHYNLVNEKLCTLSEFEYSNIEIIPYSPFVVIDIDHDAIDSSSLIDLAMSDEIEHVSLSYELMAESHMIWDDALDSIGASEVVSNSTYTGTGILIGVLETSVCDPTIPSLSGKNITIHEGSQTEISDHANKVTSVIAKMAPDAEFYCASTKHVGAIGIAWFIDEACDVVNCSFGYTYNSYVNGIYIEGPSGYRYDTDAIYDYQIAASFTNVVVASGNVNNINTTPSYHPSEKITSPSYAYNVITVGGVTKNSSGNLIHKSGACYICTEPEVKPNVSAPYDITVSGLGYLTGTSYSAPQVTGSIALLLDAQHSWIIFPEKVLSLITATARKTSDYMESVDYFDSKVGAGVIDLQAMLDNSQTTTVTWLSPVGTEFDPVYSIEINVTAGAEIQASIAWLATAINESSSGIVISDVLCPDFDLEIIGPDGDQEAITFSVYSNVEMVRCVAEKSGSYEIRVIHYYDEDEAITDDICVALSYKYE